MMSKSLALTAAVLTLFGGIGNAIAKDKKPRTEASIECSKQADAKGLHGKERKTFRASCKKSFADTKKMPDMKPDMKPEEKKS